MIVDHNYQLRFWIELTPSALQKAEAPELFHTAEMGHKRTSAVLGFMSASTPNTDVKR